MGSKFAQESEGLHPMRVNGFAIGVVNGVNDMGSELVDEFIPTRYELSILAQHYAERIWEINHFWEAHGQSGSYEIRMGPFATRRLDRIWNILADEELATTADYIAKQESILEEIREKVANPPPCSDCGISREGPLPLDMELCEPCAEATVDDLTGDTQDDEIPI